MSDVEELALRIMLRWAKYGGSRQRRNLGDAVRGEKGVT